MVSSGGSTAGRRRGDDQTIVEHVAGAPATAAARGADRVSPASQTRGSPILLSVIFILGCVAGAIGLTVSGAI